MREAEHASKAVIAESHMAAVHEIGRLPAPHGLRAPCATTYKARHYSDTRSLAAIKWIVMHSTEGDTALGAAAWFANPKSGGSAHLCIDNDHCFRTLRDDQIPWGAPGANTNGFHIEQAGYARWTTLWRSAHRALLERAAYKTAFHCKKFGIPPYFVKAAALKAGKAGITTHAECTKAFGGSHTDPGAGWPRLYFMRRVRYHHKRL
jgi:hypothetical protein